MGTSFFGQAKKKCLAIEAKPKLKKVTALILYWIPAFAGMTSVDCVDWISAFARMTSVDCIDWIPDKCSALFGMTGQ